MIIHGVFVVLLMPITIIFHRYDEWDRYSRELEELNLSVGNFTVCTLCLSS